MKESHRKGVASHPDPESCVGSCKAVGEALTGAHAGWVLSCEIIATGVPTSFRMAEGNIDGCAIPSTRTTPRSLSPQACTETPRARTRSPHRRPSWNVLRAGLRKPVSNNAKNVAGGQADRRT